MNPVPDCYAAFAERIRRTGILTDPWLDGAPRFREAPVVLDAATWRAMCDAAEAIAAAYHEQALLVEQDPGVLDSYFHLTPWQKFMWLAHAPAWHGIARADVFLTAAGPRICELNSDTPSGQAEAVLLSRIALNDFTSNEAQADGRPAVEDPNRFLEERFTSLIEAVACRTARGPGSALSVGILYPTEMPEDLSMVSLYRGWFEARGWKVTLGSPFNLAPAADGRAALLGEPCDVILRHYKTDWWGERSHAWDDAPAIPDADPLEGPLTTLLAATVEGRTAVVNPFGSVVTQNKRSLAFFWDEIERFPTATQDAIRAFIPETRRLEALVETDAAKLRAEKDRWVLKSDYGCEGDEVVLGIHCTAAEWDACLEHAVPGRWVAQERFDAETDADGAVVNHGVYLVAGRAAGIYARVHPAKSDAVALSVPVLVAGDGLAGGTR